MKKLILTYAKKSLSLVMAFVMLLTCWVFVAPEASAATTAKYSFTLTYNLPSGDSGGNIQVYYYNFKDDGSGVDTSSSGSEYVVDSYGKLTTGNGKTYTHNCTGFPYKLVFVDEDAGCGKSNRTLRITGFSINGVAIGGMGFDVNNTTQTMTYNASEGYGSITWALPVVSSISLSSTSATVNVPQSGNGSTNITATVKDQYGYKYHKLTTSHCTMNPQVTGISTNVSNNVITVNGNINVFANHSGYNSSNGKATSTLSVLMGNSGTKTASVTFQSPKYTVAFNDACGSVHNVQCYYNGSVTAPTACHKAATDTQHFAFSSWSDSTFTGIKANKSTTANYTGTNHVFEGAYVSNGDGTHSRKCTGCDERVGLNGKVSTEEGGSAKCAPGAWGGTTSEHTGSCATCGANLDHTPNWVEDTAESHRAQHANCYQPGLHYKSCSICGQNHTTETFQSAPQMEHNMVADTVVEPDCVNKIDGYTIYVCQNYSTDDVQCAYTENRDYVEWETSHDTDDEWFNETQHGTKCSKCGTIMSSADHTITGYVDTEPECGVEGVYYEFCSGCDYEKYSDIPALEHDWELLPDGVITAPTCTTEGSGEYECKLCGDTKTDDIPTDPNAHNYVITDLGDSGHAMVCTYNPDHKIDADGHAYERLEDADHPVVLPTCSATGSHYEKCSVCGNIKQFTDAIVADAHNFGEIKDLGDGTHGRVCSYNENHKTDVLAHTYEAYEDAEHPVVLPTCSATGSHYEKCSVCGNIKEVTDAIVDDAHNFGEIVDLGDGTHGRVCSHNNAHKTDVVAHSWVLVDTITPPTCSAKGSGTYACMDDDGNIICSATKTDVIDINPDAHKYGEVEDLGDGTHGKVCEYNSAHKTEVDAHTYEAFEDAEHPVVLPTCVATGSHYEKCTVCGNIKKVIDAIDPDNHDMAGAVSNNNGTHTAACKREGCTAGTVTLPCVDADKNCVCDVCGYNIPHVYDKEVVDDKYLKSEATCTDKAVYYKSCQCGEFEADDANTFETGEALGHDYTEESDEVRSEVSCLAAQTNWYGCSRCDVNAKDDPNAADKYYVVGTALEHVYTGKIKDNGNGTHSYLCINGCNEYGGATPCNYDKYTYDETNHYRVCKDCNHTETTAHTMTDSWAQTPNGGTHTKECTVCDYVLSAGCQYESVTTPAACEKDSFTTHTCKICGHNYTTVHAGTALEHNYTAKADNSNIINNGDGTHSFYCQNGCGTVGGTLDCELKFTQNADDLSHTALCPDCGYTYTEDCSGGKAYCDKQAVCDICKNGYGATDPDSHEFTTKYDGLEATCEDDGYTAYEICNACDAVLGKEVISASGHNYTGAAVEIEKGKHAYECINGCGTTGVGKEKAATEDCSGGTATCTDPAVCSICYGEYEDALGHDFSAADDRINQPEAGYHNYKCSRCDVYGIVDGEAQVVDGKIACYDAKPVRTAQTCTEYAYYTHTCDTCGYVWVVTGTEDADAPLGHDYSSQKFLDSAHRVSYATCTESAVYWYDCSRCTKNAKDETDTDKYQNLTYEYGDPLGHKFDGKVKIDEAVLATPANCVDNATYYVYCTVCKETSKGTEFEATFEDYGSKGDHTYEEVVHADFLKSEATCTAKAVYYKSCKGCKAVSGETFTHGETKPHAYTEKVMDAAHIVTKANCETAATYWYDCANCVYNAKLADKTGMTDEAIAALTYTDGEKNANNHTNLVDVAVKNPTCDEEGHSAYQKCEGCKVEIGKTVYAKTTHEFIGAAKYYDDDTHNFACVNCDAYGNNGVENAKVACSFGAWVQGTNDEGKAIHTKKCSCGNTKTGNCLDAEPTVVAPSCTAEGYTAHACDVCGNKWTTDPTEKTKHEIPTEWTSNGDGTHSRKCVNCEEGETENCSGGTATCQAKAVCTECKAAYGEIADHTEGEWKDDPARPATCYANKWQITTCTVCKTALEKEIPGTAYPQHDMSGNWVVTTEPTCASEGEQAKRCQHKWIINGTEYQCDYTDTMIIPADKEAHVWGEWSHVGGDCSTGIKEKRVCTVCGADETRTNTDVKHEMVPYAIVAPTCEEDGYIKQQCKNCNHLETVTSKDDPTLKATGHSYEKNADATTSCVEVETCSKCGKNKSTAIGVDVPGAHKWVIFAGSQPSCMSDGYTDYYHCTGCGAEKGYETIPKLEHYDNNGDGKCDDCKGKFFGSGDTDSSKDCGCICHKTSWFMQLIYKIVRFFWKLFGMNNTCDCGVAHY